MGPAATGRRTMKRMIVALSIACLIAPVSAISKVPAFDLLTPDVQATQILDCGKRFMALEVSEGQTLGKIAIRISEVRIVYTGVDGNLIQMDDETLIGFPPDEFRNIVDCLNGKKKPRKLSEQSGVAGGLGIGGGGHFK